MSNRSLLAGISPYPPMTYPCALEPHCPRPGITQELIAAITGVLGISMQFVRPENGSTGFDYVDIIEQVADGTLQIGAELYGVNLERSMDVSFSLPITGTSYWFLYKTPVPDLNAMKFLVAKPFSKQLWFSLFCFLLLIAGFLFLNEMMSLRRTKRTTSEAAHRSCAVAIRTALKQNIDYSYQGFYSAKVSLIFWAFLSLIFQNLYAGTLISHLLSVKGKAPFKTTDELAELLRKEKVRLITDYKPGTAWRMLVEDGSVPAYRKMARIFKTRPPILVGDRREMLNRILESDSHLVGVGEKYTLDGILNEFCGISVLEDTASSTKFKSFIFPKQDDGTRLRERFNQVIPTVWPYYEWLTQKKYASRPHSCPTAWKTAEGGTRQPLSLPLLLDAFWVVLIGQICGILHFLLEYFLRVPWDF